MAMPGVPAIFAGDEIGLTGVDGEHSRTPFPWQQGRTWDRETLDAYQTWIRLRREHVALRRGGLRWVHAGRDCLTFLREHPEQRVLVHAARAAHHPVDLPCVALGLDTPAQLTTLAEEPVLPGPSGAIRLPSSGPSAHAYLLTAT
jgi:alpha-glucosidase